MKIRLFTIIILTSIILTGCGGITQQMSSFQHEAVFIKENIIPDAEFNNGFSVNSQKDHTNGDAYSVLGAFTYNETDLSPLWSLSQWDSGPCIWNENVSEDKYTITDGSSKWVTYDPEEKSLLLRLNTEPYYQGKGAVPGDFWPHLLIEQNFPFNELSQEKQTSRTAENEKILLSFDIRMPYYEATPNPDNWVEAAQLYMYFGIVDKAENKFVWFGLQLFDSRYEFSQLSFKIDDGKSDASGLPIYLIGMEDVYKNSDKTFWKDGTPTTSEEWLHIEIDLKPHLESMLKTAIEKGYYSETTTPSDLYFHYMNFGWETIATFDCGVEIKNLALNSGNIDFLPSNEATAEN